MKYFIPKMHGLNEIVAEVGCEIARQTEASILGQLNDFISRGLLVVETTTPIMVRDQDSDKVMVRTMVKLKLKDAEYILSLERQVKELQGLVETFRTPTKTGE